jgi:hypothetical protein
MSPLHYKTQAVTKTGFSSFCNTFGKYSSPFPEFVEILKIQNKCKSCAGVSPKAYTCIHLFAIQDQIGKTLQNVQNNKKKSGNYTKKRPSLKLECCI